MMLPSAAEMRALEATLDPRLIDAVAPTRAPAFLRALAAIGPDPRAVRAGAEWREEGACTLHATFAAF